MSSRLAVLTARRQALQADCALQRGEVRQIYGGIEDRAARIDRAIETVSSFAPLIAVGGVALLIALGPSQSLRLLRRGLSIAVYANQAMRIFR